MERNAALLRKKFDMSDKKAQRGMVMNISSVISCVIQKKAFPEHTPVYGEPVETAKGWQQNAVGWPEDLTEEQRK